MAIDFSALMELKAFGNTGSEYFTALVMIAVGIIILMLFKGVVLIRLRHMAGRTKTQVDDVLIEILHDMNWPLYLILSAYVALQTLVLPGFVHKILNVVLVIGVAYYIVKALQDIIDFAAGRLIARHEKAEKLQEAAIVRTISMVSKGVLWAVAILMVLSNLGYNVTALVAGLGIGGLAIAFALQKVLEDIFSSVSIYFDRPFEVGDFIVIGEHMGTVKKVGIKSTRIQALQGEEIVISNRELTSIRIQNFKRMQKRRVVFALSLVYGTSNAKIGKALEIVASAIKKAKHAELDRVHFKAFGNSSLDLEVVYYLTTQEYAVYMDTQQEINLAIKEAFEKEKIEFAYPTQTVQLVK